MSTVSHAQNMLRIKAQLLYKVSGSFQACSLPMSGVIIMLFPMESAADVRSNELPYNDHHIAAYMYAKVEVPQLYRHPPHERQSDRSLLVSM